MGRVWETSKFNIYSIKFRGFAFRERHDAPLYVNLAWRNTSQVHCRILNLASVCERGSDAIITVQKYLITSISLGTERYPQFHICRSYAWPAHGPRPRANASQLASARARLVRFWASEGAKFLKMWDFPPRTHFKFRVLSDTQEY